MPLSILIPAVALAVVAATMLGELALSQRNERILFARGAIEAPDPVYRSMRWAYPLVFAVMGVEGILRGAGIGWWLIDGSGPGWWTWLGVAVFTSGKIIKYWAIATLGERWTYRVLVLPGSPLVDRGPYRFLRHPNYVGVVGELVGMLLITSAWTLGDGAIIFFGWMLYQRIVAENRALGFV
jgi:methyltransferase